jgi:hypothetical protein
LFKGGLSWGKFDSFMLLFDVIWLQISAIISSIRQELAQAAEVVAKGRICEVANLCNKNDSNY